MDNHDALIVVLQRNAFYKRLHYLALCALLLMLIVIGFLLWGLIFLIRNPTEPLYFATDNVGRLIKIIPVNTPNMPTKDVSDWTVNALQRAFTNDFVNYRAQFQSSQRFFTSFGWTNFMKAITANNNIVALTERRMIVISTVVGEPKLVTQGLLGGAYAWKFQMPMLSTYILPPYDDKSKFSNALDVNVIVQRQKILQSDNGLGITQVIANIVTTPNTEPQQISVTPSG